MTRILYVTGPDDYHALNFEQKFSLKDVVDKIKQEPDDCLVFEGEDYYFEAVLLEFEDIDPTFIKWIKTRIQDYDDAKHHNFYLVE